MYYNRILHTWVLDPLDYFFLSAIIGSLAAPRLKDYLSEKKAMKRLKNSIIKKSKLKYKLDVPILNSDQTRRKKIYRVALENRGGQFDEFEAELSKEGFKLAQEIKGLVERLAIFLKERELKGIARIFFRNGRLILELILHKCSIDITYQLLTEGLSTQVIVITVTTGGATGFLISWFSVGASLVVPPILISMLLIRSVAQQIISERTSKKVIEEIEKALDNEKIKERLRILLMESGVEVPKSNSMEMKPPLDLDKNPIPNFNSDVPSDKTPEEFIKAILEQDLGLIENPTQEQLQTIIDRKNITKKIANRNGKTVYFKDMILKKAEDPDNILDAEIVKKRVEKRIRVRIENEEL